MEQLQNIDLVLNIVIKIVFLLMGLILLIIFYKINKTLQYVKDKSNEISLTIRNTSEHIKEEITVDNFFNKFKNVIETTVQVYVLDSARKGVFNIVKKFL